MKIYWHKVRTIRGHYKNMLIQVLGGSMNCLNFAFRISITRNLDMGRIISRYLSCHAARHQMDRARHSTVRNLWDGFAVTAADWPRECPVIVEPRAKNDAVGVTVTPGTVAYVKTGAHVPDRADALVQFEVTEQIKDCSVEQKQTRVLVQTSPSVNI
ncbi:hypothetical protein Nepgr_012997 [Nepenthes gracilis]|uniref:Molybdopterin biosynthesis protein CNX1 n=1 Tax=Nepenthes gracilis TaxID=150966 RepID=A0AAD3SII0_NEPGR|nr:hypothetical protein Nepgr_012997 [Nepenthes gracilis]